MKQIFRYIAGLIGLCALTSSALEYDESIDGDIKQPANYHSAVTIFHLDVGTNIIRGTSSYSTPFNFDYDPFRFSVPQGTVLRLDSVVFEYDITNTFGLVRALGNPIVLTGWPLPAASLGYNVGDTSYPTVFMFNDGTQPFVVSPSPVTLQFWTGDPTNQAPATLPAGNYLFDPQLSWFGNNEHGATWNYSYTFIVVELP